jgi:hypothetical protein
VGPPLSAYLRSIYPCKSNKRITRGLQGFGTALFVIIRASSFLFSDTASEVTAAALDEKVQTKTDTNPR